MWGQLGARCLQEPLHTYPTSPSYTRQIQWRNALSGTQHRTKGRPLRAWVCRIVYEVRRQHPVSPQPAGSLFPNYRELESGYLLGHGVDGRPFALGGSQRLLCQR